MSKFSFQKYFGIVIFAWMYWSESRWSPTEIFRQAIYLRGWNLNPDNRNVFISIMQIFDLPITSIITDYKNLTIQTSSKKF